jgi:hypothetical protein
LDELQLLQEIGKSNRAINDAVDIYKTATQSSLYNRWKVDRTELKRHWNIAVFSVANQSAFYHTDAGYIAAEYLKDILVHDRNINTPNLATRQASFSNAFRSARESEKQSGAKADYFLIISIAENERDIAVKGELFVARTGAAAAVFNVYRAGSDRLRDAVRNICGQIDAALPFRGVLLRRASDQGLLDKGKLDGVKENGVYQIIKKGGLEIESQGIGLKFSPDDVVGTFTVGKVDEEVSAGSLGRRGIFDLVTEGDDIILQDEKTAAAGVTTSNTPADPELRAILRTLR